MLYLMKLVIAYLKLLQMTLNVMNLNLFKIKMNRFILILLTHMLSKNLLFLQVCHKNGKPQEI